MARSARRALITGISGQDGAYLTRHLIGLGYDVIGAIDPSRRSSTWGLSYLGTLSQVELRQCNLLDLEATNALIAETQPHEVYHLAAQSSVSMSFKAPAATMSANTQPTINLLESIRTLDRSIRFYHASSSEMYGKVEACPITSATLVNPASPYAVSKVAAHYTVRAYRDAYSLFAVSGVLFNHESVLRKRGFFTQKLVRTAIELSTGVRRTATFGNLNVKRDFGYAPEYVDAMHLMLQRPTPRDFLICTGRSVTLRDLVEHVFRRVGAPAEAISIDENLIRPNEIPDIYGDPTDATIELGWTSRHDAFQALDHIVDETLAMDAAGVVNPL